MKSSQCIVTYLKYEEDDSLTTSKAFRRCPECSRLCDLSGVCDVKGSHNTVTVENEEFLLNDAIAYSVFPL